MPKSSAQQKIARPPVIVVMGHIDHGKSTLLDYIRNENVVETETGGITQALSAYEVVHKGKEGNERRITFLDTPGHAAFGKMRLRGTEVADIAILVVSAEDGVKAQTLEALECITQAGIPYIVAINKIDKPNANIEKTKQQLLEHEIYLEGMGGDVSWVGISAKQGTGIPELLDLMLLVADFAELSGDPTKPAEGMVIETNLDPKKGISATLIIKNGTLKQGMFVVAGVSFSPVRIFENFLGKVIKEATFSSPVRVVGFNELPVVGSSFSSVKTKKEAEQKAYEFAKSYTKQERVVPEDEEGTVVIPLILKADVAGSLDAIDHELSKLVHEKVRLYIVHRGVGAITEGDIKLASGNDQALVIGFNTPIDTIARDTADRLGIAIHTFDIIYKLSEWLSEIIAEREPKEDTREITGSAVVLKIFSKTKNKQVLGARMETGTLTVGNSVRILRKDTEIGHGKIASLQQGKVDAKRVESGEFGARVDAAITIASGDILEAERK
jgi:translation initiation factor IF-2